MNELFMREARAEDLELLKMICYEAYISMNELGIKSRSGDLSSRLSDWLSAGSLFALCDAKDRLIGAAAYRIETGENGERSLVIEDAVLDRMHRGQGLSDRLYSYSERIGRQRGCSLLAVCADGDNFILRSSLIRNGFSFERLTEDNGVLKYKYEKKI